MHRFAAERIERQLIDKSGEVAEWLKALAWKASVRL